MNEDVTLFSRGTAPKKSPSAYLVRVLVVALLLAIIPMAPAWAVHSVNIQQAAYTGNDAGDAYTVTATTAAGATVTMTATEIEGPNADQPTVDPTQTVADSSGIVTFTVNSTNAGQTTLQAVSNDGTHTVTDTATAEWTAGPADQDESRLLPMTDTNRPGQQHLVTFTLRDAHENPISGELVTFTVTGTGAESPTGGNDTTDSEGRATFTFTSTEEGTSNITATGGGVTKTAQKTWEIGDTEGLRLDPSEAENEIGTSHTVVATLTDEAGNETNETGRVVTFTASGTGEESPSQATATTVDGEATFTFTSSKVGTSEINATIRTQSGGTATASATKDWICGPGEDTPFFGFDIARDIKMATDCGGYILDGFGGVHAYGDAPLAVSGTTPYFPNFDIARELVLLRDQDGNVTGGYILDGWGGLHRFSVVGGELPPVAASDKPYFAGNDIARDVVLTGFNQDSGVHGGYMLDGRGAIHGFGGNSGLAGAPYFTFDIARELLFAPGEESTESGYILDGWGALHPFGGKGPVFGQPYFPGNDIANDALLTSSESGFILDGYGGIHPFGANGAVHTVHPYFFGNDQYPAFDLSGVTRGHLLQEEGSVWFWFPGHVE